MNPKKSNLINYLFAICIIAFAIMLFPYKNVYSLEEAKETPRVNMGIGGLFGYYNANHIGDSPMDWDHGFGYGGGIVFENMFNKTFGLHSGIWYSHFKLKLSFPDKDTDEITNHDVKTDAITMPFYLITSLDSSIVTLNLLTGLNFSYIVYSYMDPSPDSESGENITKYLGYGQIGAGAGFEFLFKITRFTRFFISVVGEYYFVNLITDTEDGSINHLFDANIRAGIMLCTF